MSVEINLGNFGIIEGKTVISVPIDGEETLNQLIEGLLLEYPEWKDDLRQRGFFKGDDIFCAYFCNGGKITPEYVVKPGDSIRLLMPLLGG